MITNVGVQKEYQLVESLNNKKFKELDDSMQKVIRYMYAKVQDDDVITSGIMEDYIKPDLFVSINGKKKTISLKTGVNTIIHQEQILDFCKFLKECGVSETTIKTILYFHYGDGTYDGSGEERLSYAVLRARLEKHIQAANIELNTDRKLVVDLVYRFLIKGKKEENPEADYIIYQGDKGFYIIVHKDQVLRYSETCKYDFLESLHIGPILFRPHARYYNKQIKSVRRREKVEFYWPRILQDFIYIGTHYINRDS